ncbi:hypothetical protein ACWEN4_19865 [Streptomyces violaceorubidus]|uniref:hypothetical protein n=1 Tax=Streptomyces sp. x-45 TaxID=2789281 RepID=UPI0022CAD0BC|nr:hypothetical protein [Streptomyces diastatochromogenes]
MLAPLIDSTPVCYLGNDNQLVWRPCRIWQLDEQHILAVVTETTEPTMSIETAAATIRLTLEGLRQPFQVTIVEHWPAGTGAGGEHYAEQYRHDSGRIHWKHVEKDELRAKLANFDSTQPSGSPLTARARQLEGPAR